MSHFFIVIPARGLWGGGSGGEGASVVLRARPIMWRAPPGCARPCRRSGGGRGCTLAVSNHGPETLFVIPALHNPGVHPLARVLGGCPPRSFQRRPTCGLVTSIRGLVLREPLSERTCLWFGARLTSASNKTKLKSAPYYSLLPHPSPLFLRTRPGASRTLLLPMAWFANTQGEPDKTR